MLASQEICIADDTPFNLKDLIEKFKAQHDEHCQRMGITIKTEIELSSLLKPDTKRPFPHYKISCGKDFTRDLIDFFRTHDLTIHNSRSNAFYINKNELVAAKIKRKDAYEFLHNLNLAIKMIEKEMPVTN